MFSVAGCAQTRDTSTARRGVLVLWHAMSGMRERLLQDMVDGWNREQRGMLVVAERKTQDAMLIAGRRGAARPHLLLASTHIAANLDATGALAPVELAGEAGWTDDDRTDFYPYVLQAGRNASGELIGVPQGGAARVTVFNRDLLRSLGGNLQAPARDWDGFASTCARVSDPARGLACLGVDPGTTTAEQWSYAHGAVLYAQTGQFALDSVGGRAALERMRSFVQQNLVHVFAEPQQLRDDFASERTLLHVEWNDRIPELRATIKEKSGFAWGLTSLPSTTSALPAVPMQTQLWLVPRNSPQTEREGRAFVRWMLATNQAARWAMATAELPTRKTSLAEAAKQRPAMGEVIEAWRMYAPLATPLPLARGLVCANDQLALVLTGIEDGSRTVDEVLPAMRAAAAALNQDCAITR